MRLLQLNLNHCECAQHLLTQSVRELDIDIAILCEQYKNLDSVTWEHDFTGKSAIWACGRLLPQERMVTPEVGFVRMKIEDIYVYSCYASPNDTIAEFENFLHRLVSDAKGRNPVIIAGDFNAWAIEWGSRETNARGRALLEAFSTLDVVLANTGNIQTFRRGDIGSVIDLTYMSSSLVRTGITWNVSEHYTHSDHQAIIFEVRGRTNARNIHRNTKVSGWKVKAFDEKTFIFLLEDVSLSGSATTKSVQLMRYISKACDASMPRRVVNNSRPPVYWWNEEIAELRSKCLRARRLYQRARGRNSFLALRQKYNDARRELKYAIKASKHQSLKDLCEEVDEDPWGRPYKTVMAKTRSFQMSSPTCPELLHRIVTELFPKQQETLPAKSLTVDVEVCRPVTVDELIKACDKVKNNKAPGIDSIPNIALKSAIKARPDIFLDVYNSCLQEGTFPEMWKRQRLVLIPKGKKPPDEPSSYRPLCMLDTAGKILERIIYGRLEDAIKEAGDLAEHQYGFRKARSTMDAINMVISIAREAIAGKRWKRGSKKYCAIITLDVKNAFNSARWTCIRDALNKLNVPNYIRMIVANYLSDRTLIYNTDDGPKKYKVTGGVPQGSVLGPLLWNVMYDDVLRLQVPSEAKVIGFADDIAIVAVGKHIEEVVLTSNRTIAIIQRWLTSVGLVLAEHKTEAVLITSRKNRENVTLTVGDLDISSKPSILYLGMVIDARLSFKEHLEHVSRKARTVTAALSRIMPNLGGPRYSRRRLLASVTTSILLYGAPAWGDGTTAKSYLSKMVSVHRQSALRVACAFRTVSDDAICVVAGMPPIDILAEERRRIYQNRQAISREGNRQNERSVTVNKWQERWNQSVKGRWTRRLIPNVKVWIERKHGVVDYYLTQFLTGHGCFRAYLHRFQHDSTPTCPMCKVVDEDVEHVFFHCPRFLIERQDLEITFGRQLTPDNIVDLMLQSENGWNAVRNTSGRILKQLRHLERARNEHPAS